MKKVFKFPILISALLSVIAGTALAETKIGMITTLSGGGAGLGVDVRDGFMLAINQSGRSDIKVIIEDDQRKPDVAVKLADKMVQSEKHIGRFQPCRSFKWACPKNPQTKGFNFMLLRFYRFCIRSVYVSPYF